VARSPRNSKKLRKTDEKKGEDKLQIIPVAIAPPENLSELAERKKKTEKKDKVPERGPKYGEYLVKLSTSVWGN